jgi:hypothetical protein
METISLSSFLKIMKITRTITIGVLAAGIIVGAGVKIFNDLNAIDVTPLVEGQTFDIEIDDTGKPVNELRIVPTPPVEFFTERSFTLNDIISEIEIEKHRNGESERYERLLDLKAMVESQLPVREETPKSESTLAPLE